MSGPEIPTPEQQNAIDYLAGVWGHVRVARMLPMGTLCLDVDCWPVGVAVDDEGVPTGEPDYRLRIGVEGEPFPRPVAS